MNLETLITIGYYVSSVGFLIATYLTFNAFRKAPQSGLKSVLSYLFIGTGVFFAITVFQKLAEAGVYSIGEESPDIWWHVMFFLAMISYYLGFKKLARLGTSETSDANVVSSTNVSKLWGIFSAFLLVVIFIIPNWAESMINVYTNSKLAGFGLHHFIAFALAGVVGAYLFMAKLFFGQIGKALAVPMILALWSLALQHFWELLTESWKVIQVTSENIEGVEKIFLTIAAICVIFATLRLKSFVKA
jgi:hypothetical protein